MEEQFDITIIIINYNTFKLAKNAIESMFLCTQNLKLQVIVIDNDSPDGSGKNFKEEFGDKIIYIQAEENLGTSKAFNRALKFASGKYVLWLNPDTIFIENFIKKLYDFMETHLDCGVCGGNLVDKDGKPSDSFNRKMISVETVKKDNSLTRHFFREIFKKRLSLKYNYTDKPLEVGCVIGADMMVRREIFDKIGGFDEDIFMYAEETEFQFRVKKLTDYKIYSVPTARLIHLEGQSFSGRAFSERRHRLAIKGTSVFIEKSYGKDAAFRYFNQIIKDYKKFTIVFWAFKHKKEIYKTKWKTAKVLKEEFAEKKK